MLVSSSSQFNKPFIVQLKDHPNVVDEKYSSRKS